MEKEVLYPYLPITPILDGFCCTTESAFQCTCGEEHNALEWHFDQNCIPLVRYGRLIIFHLMYSFGRTLTVRGNTPFPKNKHHFWELKVLSILGGTEVMIGIGTSKISLKNIDCNNMYSFSGSNTDSWGYSFHGNIQYNGCCIKYGRPFNINSLIGVHLDMCSGKLEYYLDGVPLGVAFRGLKSKVLYPMISSTAANSALKLVTAVSVIPNLQFRCFQIICKHKKLLDVYKSIPALRRIYDKKYFWLIPKECPTCKLSLQDEAVISDSSFESLPAKRFDFANDLENDSEETYEDIYRDLI